MLELGSADVVVADGLDVAVIVGIECSCGIEMREVIQPSELSSMVEPSTTVVADRGLSGSETGSSDGWSISVGITTGMCGWKWRDCGTGGVSGVWVIEGSIVL